jgi:hypothetical protein
MVMRIQWATALNAIGRAMRRSLVRTSKHCGLLLATSSII